MLFSWYRGRVQHKADGSRKPRGRRRRGAAPGWKPTIEALEQRTVLSLFGPPTFYPTPTTPPHGPGDVAIGDINGDGKLDLVSANREANNVSVFLGNGDGTFRAPQNHATGSVPGHVALGDLNGDNRLDIVVDNDFGGSATVLLNQGSGAFARTDYPLSIGIAVSVALGDLDNDGDLDIVVSDYSGSKVAVLLGHGDGTFTSQTPFSVPGTNTRNAVLGDLNGDGKLDLAVVYQNSAYVSVLPGHGDGTFGAGTSYNKVGIHGGGLALGDVDADGDLDIVASNSDANSVSVLLNHGDGTFAPQTEYPAGTNPAAVALGDVNGDGHLDILVPNAGSNDVSVLLGQGDGTFGPKTDYAAGTNPVSAALGDLNGDGRLDAVVVAAGQPALAVLLNSPVTAPSVTCSVTDSQLWPPNHKLVNVGLGVTVDPADASLRVQVYANDAAVPADAADIGPGTLRLRAERQGNGQGRVYLLVVTATAGGQTAFDVCTVVVPHDRSAGSLAQVQAAAAAAAASYQEFQTAPPGFHLLGEGPAAPASPRSPVVAVGLGAGFRFAPTAVVSFGAAPSPSPTPSMTLFTAPTGQVPAGGPAAPVAGYFATADEGVSRFALLGLEEAGGGEADSWVPDLWLRDRLFA
jgi:hypothetical protein